MFESMTMADWMSLLRMALPLIALLGAAAIVFLWRALRKEDDSLLPLVFAFAGIAASFVLSWLLWPQVRGEALAMLIFDRVAVLAWMLVVFSAAACLAMALPSMRAGELPIADLAGLVLLSSFGMGVLASAGDLVAILIGLETMSLAAYALAGIQTRRAPALEGALKCFLMGIFATAFFIMGIAFLLGSAGTTDLALLAQRAPEVAAGETRAFFLFGCAMATIGFAFKVAAAPFHAWAPDAYEGASTPVAALLATGIKVAAVVAFARFALASAVHGGVLWHHLMWVLAALTMLWGNLAALRQENLKRMLAYSSIAHTGYLLVLFPSAIAEPLASMRALLLYLIASVVMTAGAFAAVEGASRAGAGQETLAGIAGMGRRQPWLAAAFTLFLVSLAGFPPTLGFFARYDLFLTAVAHGDVALVALAVFSSAISVAYYLRPVVAMYFVRRDRVEKDLPAGALSPAVVAVLIVAALTIVAFGILPQNLVAFVRSSVF